MRIIQEMFEHPDDLYPLLKLKMAAKQAETQIPSDPHWEFCYSMLNKVSRSFALVIQMLGTELRDAVCVFYLVLRALDTVEDDTSLDTMVKIPILMEFHRHIYDTDWKFECGTKEYKILMDQFCHVSTAFLELNDSYQEAIEDITMKMGAGMAKFVFKEVDTIKDYDEYCHYSVGLVGLGLSKLFHASGKEMLFHESISNSMGLFLQKTNIIRDYLEDINETPKPRIFWPRQIWSKYIDKLENLKHRENSLKAVQCLNEMVTNALLHIEDCLKYMSNLRDPEIFKFGAIPQKQKCNNNRNRNRNACLYSRGHEHTAGGSLYGSFEGDSAGETETDPMILQEKGRNRSGVGSFEVRTFTTSFLKFMAIGTLTLCYNNVEVFRGVVKLRRGLTAKIIDRTKTMADVYGAFFEFSSILRSKVNMKDPNASTTISRIEAIQRICRKSGTLDKRKSYISGEGPSYVPALIGFVIVILAILYAYLSRLNKISV